MSQVDQKTVRIDIPDSAVIKVTSKKFYVQDEEGETHEFRPIKHQCRVETIVDTEAHTAQAVIVFDNICQKLADNSDRQVCAKLVFETGDVWAQMVMALGKHKYKFIRTNK